MRVLLVGGPMDGWSVRVDGLPLRISVEQSGRVEKYERVGESGPEQPVYVWKPA